MKTLLTSLTLILFLSACSSVSTTVGNTLAAIGTAENGAMVTAANAEVAHTITEAQWQQIATAHGQFLASYDVACSAAAVALDKAAVPADVTALEQNVLNLVATFIPTK